MHDTCLPLFRILRLAHHLEYDLTTYPARRPFPLVPFARIIVYSYLFSYQSLRNTTFRLNESVLASKRSRMYFHLSITTAKRSIFEAAAT